MNKKIILSLGSAVLLASSLYAGSCNNSQKCDGYNKHEKKMCNKGHKRDHNKAHKNHRFIKTVMKLDLSDKQREDIRSTMRENMKNRVNPNEAFTAKDFDKELFIKLSEQKRESKLQNKANMIESVYNLLDDSQKQELKKMLDQKPMMKHRARK